VSDRKTEGELPAPSAPALPQRGVHGWTAGANEAARRDAGARRLRWVEVDVGPEPDRRGILRAIGKALAFPPHYGANLDALHDCLGELAQRDGVAGWVVMLSGLRHAGALDAATRAALLEVFEAACEELAAAGRELVVLYD